VSRFGLRSRLTLVALGVSLLGSVLGLALTYAALLGTRVARIDDEGRLLASLTLESAVRREGEVVRVPRVVESYLTDLEGVSVAHVYLDGTLIWEGGVVDAPRPLDAERLLVGDGPARVGDWRVYTVRDEDAGMVVQVGQPLQAVRGILEPYLGIALAVLALVGVASGLLAWSSVGAALRPLRRLTAAAEGFESSTVVPDIPGRDEPAKLARSFAELLGRLGRERDRERAFLEYASHELRTPVTALRAGLEGLATGRTTVDGELLERLHQEALRLEKLAQNLTVLSRTGSRNVRLGPVDLETVVSEAYDRFQPLALERSVTLTLHTSSAPVRAEARLLDQAVNNLIDNAFRAARQGRVVLRCGVEGGRALLEVTDDGPGMPANARDGLGLRVVRDVAKTLGGSFEIVNEAGAHARLWLPPAPAVD